MTVAVQILVTVGVLSFAAVASAADLNRTHATNPRWVAHARFHVVWQVFTHIGIGVLALVLTWVPLGPIGIRVGVAMGISLVVLGGFFLTWASMRSYGGELADPNGYRPVHVRLGHRRFSIDQNVLLFSVGSSVLAAALILIVINGGV
ncbi:hypothetical protein BH92_26835 (plasmid) [Rhodococcoides fascians A21d2]|uniref:hypothetical protein n=1 Tax=Rhodococcoides fascians TaxID=1828 RepID=UPI00068C40A5|nr:hypothetical protein [Rhodococcus fascians]QII03680.1 hypothetical protein BH92_26835 [Rhodococcus fascians A21d2]